MDPISFTEMHRPDVIDMLVQMLRRSYWAESYMSALLDELQPLSVTPGITRLLHNYKLYIRQQAGILAEALSGEDKDTSRQASAAFESLWREAAQQVYQAPAGSRLRDAAIVIAVQQMAAHKAGNYQIIASFLRLLNYGDMAGIVEDCLIEEKERHAELTELAATQLFTSREEQ